MTTARARSRVANGGPMQQRGRRIVEARLRHVGDDVGNLNLCPRRVEPDDRQGERRLAMIRVADYTVKPTRVSDNLFL